VRRFLARRAPRLRLRGFDTLRFLDDARRRLQLAEREEADAALRLVETLAVEAADGARGFDAARRRRRAFRFTLPLRRFLDADRRRRALLRGAGDGDAVGAGAFGTDERLRLRRDAVERDRELRFRLAERELRERLLRLAERELRERLEREREEEEGDLGVELRRRRLEEERLRDCRFGCFTLRARGAGDADMSRFRDSFRFA